MNSIDPSKELTKPFSPFERSMLDLLNYNLEIEKELTKDDLKFLVLEQNLERVTLIGEENLPKNSNKDDITFFTPSHRDAFKDMVSVAGLGVDNIIPFAAAGNFIPSNIKLGKHTIDLSRIKSFLIGRLNDNNGIIVVGNKNNPNPINPVTKFLQIIKQTNMRNFLIYPEGKLPDETGATGVVREKLFSADGPIAQAEKLGLKVNLVPISMRLNYLPNGNSNNIEIDVQPMIDDYTRIKWYRTRFLQEFLIQKKARFDRNRCGFF